jgi:hypothetical protein
MSLLDHRSRESLWRLDSNEIIARYSFCNRAILIHSLECVDYRKSGGRAISFARFRDHCIDRLHRDERPRRVVHDDNRNGIGKVLEAVANRIAPLTPADGKQESLCITLEKPGRRITHMFVRENDNDHRDIVALLKCLHAVQKHRLAGDPPKLLELFPDSARPLSAGDDYNADVTHH